MAEMNFGGVIETVVTSKEFSREKAREVLKNETIAVIGYGIQGPGQACNLRDNGLNVLVGPRPGKTLYYSHGFAINWSDRTGVVPPKDVDVILVAPKGSGTSLRTMFCEGRGLNCSYAVYQDASGKAEEKTLAFGIGIGAGYLFKTTFEREATSDLTGERGSLMGAIQGLLLAQYEVLRENGHSPSEAFNETVEELTQSLGPLFGAKGMDWMYANCSTTAQRGALDWAPRFHDAIKPVMQQLYESVKNGTEAQISIDSNSKPDYREGLEKELEAMRNQEMWRAGAVVRQLRPENN